MKEQWEGKSKLMLTVRAKSRNLKVGLKKK